jgi:hypothetical protein
VARSIDLKRMLPLMYGLVLLSNITIFSMMMFKQGLNVELFSTRLWLATDEGKATINPITISLYGAYLFVLSLVLLTTNQLAVTTFQKALVMVSMMLGLLNLVLGASRGPMLFTVLAFVTVLLNAWRLNRFSSRGLFIFLGVLSALFVFFYFFVWPLIADIDFEFISRIAFSLEGGVDGEDRDLSIAAAWQDFLHNPVIGSSFVGTLDGYYPHNIVVEALMATGILGGIWFLAYLFIVLFKCFVLLYKKISFPFAIIMLGIIASSLLSGSLFMGVDLWPWSVFIISLYNKNLEAS